jgi:hypothetical protein
MIAGATAVLACLLVIYATPGDAYWICDCGNKALLAERLLETSYTDLNFDYPGASIDPDQVAFPIPSGFAVHRAQGFASAFPPAYSAVAAPFLGLLGPPGLRLPAALGVGACALLLALWLSPSVGRWWAGAAGLFLAQGTPLFFYGVTVWEHSITVALSLWAWVVLTRPSWPRLLCAGLLIGSASWFREELILMGLALACACYVRWRRLAVLAVFAGGLALPVAGLAAFNWSAYGNPSGPHITLDALAALQAFGEDAAMLIGRQLGSLLIGVGASGTEVVLLLSTAIGVPLAGWLAAWLGRGLRLATGLVLAAGLGTWILASTQILAADRPFSELIHYNGLMAQMPIFCAAGIGLLWVWRDRDYAGLRIGVTAGSLFLLLVTVSSLGSQRGFGIHWGPRVLMPALPAIVALAMAAARSKAHGAGTRRVGPTQILWASLVAAGLLSSAHATWFLNQQKTEAARLQETILSLPRRFVVTTHPFLPQQLAPLWDRRPMLLVTVRHRQTLERLAGEIRRGGAHGFLYLAPPSAPILDGIEGVHCSRGAEHRGRHLHYLDMDLQVCGFRSRG